MRCGKRRYSKINAKIALATMQAKDKGAKRIYYHADCKAWHITSQVKRENRNKSETKISLNTSQEETGESEMYNLSDCYPVSMPDGES